LKAEGGIWRFSVVLGLLVAVVSFGGGLSVSAEGLENGVDRLNVIEANDNVQMEEKPR
jgi:hypothetical protein